MAEYFVESHHSSYKCFEIICETFLRVVLLFVARTFWYLRWWFESGRWPG